MINNIYIACQLIVIQEKIIQNGDLDGYKNSGSRR